MSENSQMSFSLLEEKQLGYKMKIVKDIIIDRKSKYTVVGGYIQSKEDIENFLQHIMSDPYFKKSTHNSYAYRIKQKNGSIIEGKNDDGETGAGLCILREIQRENGINMIIVVTRYFGGIKLMNDRYKNIIEACKIFFKNSL